MNRHVKVFGLYIPGNSPVHRWPVGVKYLLMFLGGILPFLIGQLWVSGLALIGAVLALVVLARLPVKLGLALPLAFWVMMAFLVAYHWIFTSWREGVLYFLNLSAALYLARLLTMTTPISAMMDAMAFAARPLRYIGVDPQRVALAIALMWRSVPYLLGSLGDIGDAAKARGLERASVRFIVPVIINAVGYALQTGDALKARGLED